MSGGAAREVFAKFTTEADGSALLNLASIAEGLFGKLSNLGGLLVHGAIAGGLIHMVESTIEAGESLEKTSQQVGINKDALSLWLKAANLANVGADELTNSLRFLQRNAFEASTGGKEQAAAFKALGVDVKGTNGDLKDADTLLREMADGFAKTENPAKRVALAQQLLGRSGARLLPLLNKGAEGIEEVRHELEELGIGFDTSWTEKAVEAEHAQKKFNMVLGSLKTKLAVGVIPLFTKFFTLITHFIGILNKAVKGTNAIKAVLITLGAVAAVMAVKTLIAFAPLIASTLLWAAAIGIIVLAIDEIITTLEGGDSILRRWIDDTWGAGATDEAVKAIKDAWDSVGPALAEAWDWFKSILPSIQTVSTVLKALGQDIAFVVDQFRNLSQFKEGIAKLGHDIGVQLGVSDKTADEKRFAHGAEGFGSVNTQIPTEAHATRGGNGFFSDFTKFSGDAGTRAAAQAPPGFIGPPAPPGGPAISNQVTVHIAANAKPDPALANHIKRAVQDGLDAQNREAHAAVHGS